MNTVKIIIKGPAGSGKTTLTTLIHSSLQALGFSVSVDDPDWPLISKHEWIMKADQRINSIKESSNIVIRTKSTK